MVLDDVLVVELHGRLNFVSEEVHELGVVLRVAQVEDLDCVFTSIVLVGELDLGAEARAKSFGYVIVIERRFDWCLAVDHNF